MHEEVAVIGGGFYGCIIALELSQLGMKVTLIERELDLLQRASLANQARIHQGYHYPRNLLTGLRSRQNFREFVKEFPDCVTRFDKYYAIASKFSKVTARQFFEFCKRIGAPIGAAPTKVKRLFESKLIEEVFKVEEFAFDAAMLKQELCKRLQQASLDLELGTEVSNIQTTPSGYALELNKRGAFRTLQVAAVFNCTYSNINKLLEKGGFSTVPLKHEYAEIALVEPPPALEGIGITVMDGPFFSLMPFPSRKLYSLSHVRYTPHYHWVDEPGQPIIDGHQRWRETKMISAQHKMILDAARYLPCLACAQYRESIFEIKTVLPQSEINDGRPILFHESSETHGFYSIMGGKIDNISDVREFINNLYATQDGAINA